jgi:hypothetical protein
MKCPAILLGLVALASCAAPAVISDINDSALRIQVNALTPPAEIAQRARDGCAIYGKEPVPISSRCVNGNCDHQELLFACKAPSGGGTTSTAAAPAIKQTLSGAYDGKWTAESPEEACGLPWAMQVDVRNGAATGMLWRGKIAYNFAGTLDGDGRLVNVLAGKTESSNGLVGPRFITINAAFTDDSGQGDYSMPAVGVGTCVVSFNLSRHQA